MKASIEGLPLFELINMVFMLKMFSGTVIKVLITWYVTPEVPKDRHEGAEDIGPSQVQVRRRKPQRKPQRRIRRMSSAPAMVQIIRSFNSSLTCKCIFTRKGSSMYVFFKGTLFERELSLLSRAPCRE